METPPVKVSSPRPVQRAELLDDFRGAGEFRGTGHPTQRGDGLYQRLQGLAGFLLPQATASVPLRSGPMAMISPLKYRPVIRAATAGNQPQQMDVAYSEWAGFAPREARTIPGRPGRRNGPRDRCYRV
jgi:hypothetical protein